MAVPYITIAPSGCVMLAPGVPENCTVLVVGLTAVWAFAKTVAKQASRQQQIPMTFLRADLPCCPAGGISVEFKLCLSLPVNLWLREILICGKQHYPLTVLFSKHPEENLVKLIELDAAT
jgi:hypothetical protein